MSYAIRAEGLVKRFGKVTALASVDLAVPPGTVLGLLGPNGAGKTTAVRIFATLLKPDAGTAAVAGFDVVRHAASVRRLIGLTGQYASVDEDLTGRENLVLIGRLLDMSLSTARARAAELLGQFELDDAADRTLATYSGGMRRRLDLACSQVGRPAVIFLDEPTTGLDPARREGVWRMIRTIVGEGTTVMLTTQYLDEADALADALAVVDRGTVVATGTTSELKQVIGGQTVVVRPRDPALLDRASAVLAGETGRRPDRGRSGTLSVAVDDEETFPRLVARLHEAGVVCVELSLRLPSLDDAFFTLTGSRTDAKATREDPR